MALFGKKENKVNAKGREGGLGQTEAPKDTVNAKGKETGLGNKKEAAKQATTLQNPVHVASTIIKPRITEKAALLTDKNVYTFEVSKGANKYEIRDAIKALYNVTPVKVNIVNKSPRHYLSRSRGRNMMEHGMRKAYVYLKKGDRIELV